MLSPHISDPHKQAGLCERRYAISSQPFGLGPYHGLGFPKARSVCSWCSALDEQHSLAIVHLRRPHIRRRFADHMITLHIKGESDESVLRGQCSICMGKRYNASTSCGHDLCVTCPEQGKARRGASATCPVIYLDHLGLYHASSRLR
jgi:hypothetical protein